MRRTRTLLAAGVACVALASAAVAQGVGGMWHGGQGMRILHALNLSDSQKAGVGKIEQAAWTSRAPLLKQMHAIHHEIVDELLSSKAVTADQLTPLVQQEEGVRSQLDLQRLNTVLQIRALLTPEQLAHAASLVKTLDSLHQQEHDVLSGRAVSP